MRRLNRKFRGVNNTTDVLAFSMREGAYSEVNPDLLGDVVICVDAARRYASQHGSTILKEINLYLIHGILHLLGYDDQDAKNRRIMRQKEKEILKKL